MTVSEQHPAPARRRALVTGASGAIGGAIARTLAADGFHVLAHANTGRAAVEALVADLQAAGHSAEALVFDVTDTAACAAALANVLAQGAVQVLVANAGVHDDAVFAGMTPLQWQRVIDVNLNGFYNVAQPLMLPMLRTRWGRIVAITSRRITTSGPASVFSAAVMGQPGRRRRRSSLLRLSANNRLPRPDFWW